MLQFLQNFSDTAWNITLIHIQTSQLYGTKHAQWYHTIIVLYHLTIILMITDSCSNDHTTHVFSQNNIVSESCEEAIYKRLSTLQSIHPQLMGQYLDSWGKPSDGIVYGYTTFLHHYDQCMDLKKISVSETSRCILCNRNKYHYCNIL